jgi:predicted RND superfamily exporter protein
MFAAITLGIGVDYAIHLLERFRLARGSGRSVEESLVEAVKITGPPVLIDALAVSLGFGIMTLSLVPANARLGGLVVLNLVTCLAATLLLLPALLSIWRPGSTIQSAGEATLIPSESAAS